MGSMKQN